MLHNLPSRQLRRLLAVSFAIGATLGLAACTAPNGPAAVTVTVNPAATTLHVGQAVTFNASVTGAQADVTWSGDCGALEPDGVSAAYRAPWAPGTCTVTATSIADPTASGSATITITRVPDGINLLPNPGFAADLSSWQVYFDEVGPRATWNPDDVAGSGASGSAEAAHRAAGAGGLLIALQACVAADPSSAYLAGGAGRGVTGIGDGIRLEVWVSGFLDASCESGTEDPGSAFSAFVLADSEGEWSHGGGHFSTSPDGAAILVLVGITKPSGADPDPSLARTDDLFLVQVD